MTVEELLSRISSAELTEWMAYEEIVGPLDVGYRVDVVAGIVSSTIANVNRGKKGRRFKPDDFTPSWGGRNRRRRPQTPEEQLAVVRGINAALGGTVRKREEA